MLRFCGFDLELTVDSVLERRLDEPTVCSATDPAGQRWLIVEAGGEGDQMSWICAPTSDRAVELVVAGRAAAIDAVLHSLTGWVEVVRMVSGHSLPDQRLSCSELAGGWLGTGRPGAASGLAAV